MSWLVHKFCKTSTQRQHAAPARSAHRCCAVVLSGPFRFAKRRAKRRAKRAKIHQKRFASKNKKSKKLKKPEFATCWEFPLRYVHATLTALATSWRAPRGQLHGTAYCAIACVARTVLVSQRQRVLLQLPAAAQDAFLRCSTLLPSPLWGDVTCVQTVQAWPGPKELLPKSTS